MFTPLQCLAALRDLHVTAVTARHGPAPFHVVGHQGSPAAFCNIYVREADVLVFAEEFRAHLQVPPVWTAFLGIPESRRSPLPAAWMWGFMRARTLLLPHRGVFQPTAHLHATWEGRHADSVVQQARTLGLLAYRDGVQRACRPFAEAAD